MKTLTFKFEISDGELEYTVTHDGVSPYQIYTCALIASRASVQNLTKAMAQNGTSDFDRDKLFDKARDFAREYVDA
ncbi:MAG: hypothetical protein R3Y11_08455 [Pseudomonadota bacterium]